MACTCMLFTFENEVTLMRYGASVVWHHSLLLMNSFIKTEAAVFSCRLCFLMAFSFHQCNCNETHTQVIYSETTTSGGTTKHARTYKNNSVLRWCSKSNYRKNSLPTTAAKITTTPNFMVTTVHCSYQFHNSTLS